MKNLILATTLLASLGAFAQEPAINVAKVIDFDGRSFAQPKKANELKIDAPASEIQALARREFSVHKAVLNVKNDRNMLQVRASEDLFGDSIFIDFKSRGRAKLAKEVIDLGQVDILVDQVRVGAIPNEKQVFIHDKLSGKVVELSPFLDELRRNKELENGDYKGLDGFFRSVMDRIKGVGTYAEKGDEEVEDSDRSIAADKDEVVEEEAIEQGASAQSN